MVEYLKTLYNIILFFNLFSYPFGVVSLLLLGHLVKFASESKKPKFFIMGIIFIEILNQICCYYDNNNYFYHY